ncbi:MAG: ABC transporter substrate-binding protein [Pseudomonadota bacterium]
MTALLCPLLCLLTIASADAQPPLPTIVSTQLCADHLALSLAAPAQILSLSYKSQDPLRSTYAERAQHYPGNSGKVEEIIALKPDIVLASRRWRRHPMKPQLEALGIRVVIPPHSKSWQDIFEHTQWLADQIGRPERGRQQVEQLRQRLALLPQIMPSADTARNNMLFLRPNGGSAGSDTHIHMLIEALGFNNYASQVGLKGWGRFSLEQVVMQSPDYLLLSAYVRDQAYARSQLSRHPVLKAIVASKPSLILPGKYGSCANWTLIETAEYLAEQLHHSHSQAEQALSKVRP